MQEISLSLFYAAGQHPRSTVPPFGVQLDAVGQAVEMSQGS